MASKQKLPKWLVLQEDEVFIKSFMAKQPLFIVTMSSSLVMMAVFGLQYLLGDGGDATGPLMVAFGSITTLATTIAAKKAYLTNMRVITGTNSKPEQEIRLTDIQAMEDTQKFPSGSVQVVGKDRQAKPMVINDLKPQNVALAIQEAARYADPAS